MHTFAVPYWQVPVKMFMEPIYDFRGKSIWIIFICDFITLSMTFNLLTALAAKHFKIFLLKTTAYFLVLFGLMISSVGMFGYYQVEAIGQILKECESFSKTKTYENFKIEYYNNKLKLNVTRLKINSASINIVSPHAMADEMKTAWESFLVVSFIGDTDDRIQIESKIDMRYVEKGKLYHNKFKVTNVLKRKIRIENYLLGATLFIPFIAIILMLLFMLASRLVLLLSKHLLKYYLERLKEDEPHDIIPFTLLAAAADVVLILCKLVEFAIVGK